MNTPPDRRVVIPALGITEIFAWGSTFYLPGALAPLIANDTGWPYDLIVAGGCCGGAAGRWPCVAAHRADDRRKRRPAGAGGGYAVAGSRAHRDRLGDEPPFLSRRLDRCWARHVGNALRCGV